MIEQPNPPSPSAATSGWTPVGAASPSREDCALDYGEDYGGKNWTGFVWVMFRGRVAQGIAYSSDSGVEILPSMAGGVNHRHEITHWHPMRAPAPVSEVGTPKAEAKDGSHG